MFTQVTFSGPYAYNPINNDKIDERIAEYINVHPNRGFLKIFFRRETNGIYHFGTKRVSIKIENNHLKCRVGGGYLSIEEFVEQYLPIEFEKADKSNFPKKFQQLEMHQQSVYQNYTASKSPNIRQRSFSPTNNSQGKKPWVRCTSPGSKGVYIIGGRDN